MENLFEKINEIKENHEGSSRLELERFFLNFLQEMYYSETVISSEFLNIKNGITSVELSKILDIHHVVQLKHRDRLEKIFKLRDKVIEGKDSETLYALINDGLKHLAMFSNDPVNWDIALILVSQKLAHYKIACYSGLAHLAINLNYHTAATLLSVSVQEEEEFLNNNLNNLFDAFVASHVEGYKR